MLLRTRILLLAGAVVFLVNPSFACNDEPDFQFGAEEMRAAVEGTWMAALMFDDGRQANVTFSLEQGTATATASSTTMSGASEPPMRPRRHLVRTANACNDRTFVKSAGACISYSKMPVAGTFVTGDDAYRTVPIAGELVIGSLIFGAGAGTLTLRLGPDTLYTQSFSPDGQAMNVQVRNPPESGGTVVGTATLVRLMP